MHTSIRGVAALAREEGVGLRAYKDSAGVLTIAVGHTDAAGPPKVTAGMSVTLEQAFDILRADLGKYEDAVRKLVKVPLSQHEFDALVSFTFNVGPGALQKSTLLKLLNNGNREGAGDQFLRWNKAGGQVLQGLSARRVRERDMFLHGRYGSLETIAVYDGQPGRVKPRAVPLAPLLAGKPDDPGTDAPEPRQPMWQAMLSALGDFLLIITRRK